MPQWNVLTSGKVDVTKKSPNQGISCGRLGRGSTTLQQNNSTIVFHTYIAYTEKKRQAKTISGLYRTDGPTDQWTDRPTDTARCRVASPQLKNCDKKKKQKYDVLCL